MLSMPCLSFLSLSIQAVGLVEVAIVKEVLALTGLGGNGHVVAVFVGEIGVIIFYPVGHEILKGIGGGPPQYAFVQGAVRPIVVVGHQAAGIIIVLLEQAADLALHTAERVALAAQQRHP